VSNAKWRLPFYIGSVIEHESGRLVANEQVRPAIVAVSAVGIPRPGRGASQQYGSQVCDMMRASRFRAKRRSLVQG
jgi:hypothetical protein